MKRQILFALALGLLFLSRTGYSAQDAPKGGQAIPQPFTVRALLVGTDGKPIPNEPVYCFIFAGGAAYAQLGLVDGKITPINPKGTSDKNGRVEIKIDSGFIQKHQAMTREFTIGVVRDGKPMPMRLKGVQVIFDLDLVRKAKNIVDLGKITLEAK